MFKATQDINSPVYGKIKKGQEVPFNQTWADAGLIEQSHESKPEPKASKQTKPAKARTEDK